jgi:hypothetical protein
MGNNMSIEKLRTKRIEFIKQMEENNYNANHIIANLYSESSHFIYELIQNAEDTEASKVEFYLKQDSLEVIHNGILFDEKDIESITTIGHSTKKDNLNKIGKFGAGFKSVYAITNRPRIYSGQYCFDIENYLIPNIIEPIELKNNLTKIILPFNIENKNPYEIISNKLQTFEPESLLFLKNIKSIHWYFENSSGYYQKSIKKSSNCEYIKIQSITNNLEQSKEYIKIDEIINIDKKDLTISVAYELKDNKIIPIVNSKLSVFFPTKINIYYKFLLQAPYKTTPNRESIPIDDTDNQEITKYLSKLVAKSFLILQNQNLYNIDFLESMNIDCRYTSSKLHENIYNEIRNIFISESLLPTNDGKYAKASEIIIASDNNIMNILETDYTKLLFKKNNIFIKPYSNNFTRYLNSNLRINVFSDSDIFSKIDEYIVTKNNKWLIKFYLYLLKRDNIKFYLSKYKIIKLDNNEFVPLYKDYYDKHPQVYIPTETKTNFKIINKIFVENKELQDFISKYEITKPNYISEINEFIISKYKNTPQVSIEEYFNDFDKIIEVYKVSNETDKNKIISLCKDKYIILCEDDSFLHAELTYFQTGALKDWFGNNMEINYGRFIHQSLNSNKYKEILEKMNINTIPRFINYYTIHGLDMLFDNINIEKSITLWDFFIKSITNFYIKRNQDYDYNKYIDIIKSKINNTECIKSKNSENLVKPSEITIDELDKAYQYPSEIKQYIDEKIKFKLTEIKQIEEKLNGKFVTKDEYEQFKKWQEEQNINNTQNSSNQTWKPNNKIDSIKNIEFKHIKNSTSNSKLDLSYQVQTQSNNNFQSNYKYQSYDYDNIESRKAIGDWGENLVNKFLIEKYKNTPNIQIKCLNQNGNIGKGYDFVIIENNIEIEYIEVKSKVSKTRPIEVSISATQWEWAKELNNNNNGDKYKIYIVLGAGSESATIDIISNPVQMFKDGKIKANPINIEI